MRRTWSVRPINLCTFGGKSAAKAGAREIPRVHKKNRRQYNERRKNNERF